MSTKKKETCYQFLLSSMLHKYATTNNFDSTYGDSFVSPVLSPPPWCHTQSHQPHAGPHPEPGGHLTLSSTGVEVPPRDGVWALQGPALVSRHSTIWEVWRRRHTLILQGGAPSGDPCSTCGLFVGPAGESTSQRGSKDPATPGRPAVAAEAWPGR